MTVRPTRGRYRPVETESDERAVARKKQISTHGDDVVVVLLDGRRLRLERLTSRVHPTVFRRREKTLYILS